jgi:predicted nucleotidyltransferase
MTMTRKEFSWDTCFDGRPAWLPARTIFLTVHGSHAYGTNIETSDTDFRGICIAPKEYYLGYFGYLDKFEHKVQTKSDDLTVFELRKFLRLATVANPNALEIIFTDESDHQIISPAGRVLIKNRDLFLSRKCKHTFSGYAHKQLGRIKTHKDWLDNPPERAPLRSEYDLPPRPAIEDNQLKAAMSAINKQLDSWSADFLDDLDPDLRILITRKISSHLAEIGIAAGEEFAAAARLVGFTENFIRMLDKERRYNSALQHYGQYLDWKQNRNPERAALEAKYGYDSKHGMHLVRLLLMCEEILTRGEMIVKRPDAQKLLRVRAGEWTYSYLIGWADEQDRKLDELMLKSPLPKEPDRTAIDQICLQLVESSF